MNKIFGVIKTHKKAIIKKALIIGGAIVGLVIVLRMVPKTEYAGIDATDEDVVVDEYDSEHETITTKTNK